MKLYALSQVPPDADARVCRQGRLTGIVCGVIIADMLIAAAVFWWVVGAPWIVWGLCALLALLVVPMLVGDMRNRLRPNNWILSVRQDGIWINFQSYQDTTTTEEPTVVHFSYDEIQAVRQHVEKFTMPGGDVGDTTQRELKCLDVCLTHGQTDELRNALVANRQRKPAERVHLGFIRVSTRPTVLPVSLAAADVVRLSWRGGQGNWVAPSLQTILKDLQRRVTVAEPVQYDRGNWKELSEAELDEQILQLVEWGARIDAIKLLIRRRRYTLTDATRFVDELACRV